MSSLMPSSTSAFSSASTTNSRMSGASSDSRSMSEACCEDTTTVSRRTALSPSYSMVTWVLPSGRRYGMVPFLRTSERRFARRCARKIGNGISVGVSSVAYPNIRPWSPAPCLSSSSSSPSTRFSYAVSTPCAMSGDCAPMDTETPQEAPSKPFLEES